MTLSGGVRSRVPLQWANHGDTPSLHYKCIATFLCSGAQRHAAGALFIFPCSCPSNILSPPLDAVLNGFYNASQNTMNTSQ